MFSPLKYFSKIYKCTKVKLAVHNSLTGKMLKTFCLLILNIRNWFVFCNFVDEMIKQKISKSYHLKSVYLISNYALNSAGQISCNPGIFI